MSHKVLLFDRDEVSLSAMRDLLHRSLCQVGCGQTIDDVTALATAHDWDVAIVDLLSDQSVGLEVLRKLRQLPRPPACVVTVRFGHETWKSEAMALGAFHCIEQPLTAALLVALIHATAEARRSDVDRMHPGGVVC